MHYRLTMEPGPSSSESSSFSGSLVRGTRKETDESWFGPAPTSSENFLNEIAEYDLEFAKTNFRSRVVLFFTTFSSSLVHLSFDEAVKLFIDSTPIIVQYALGLQYVDWDLLLSYRDPIPTSTQPEGIYINIARLFHERFRNLRWIFYPTSNSNPASYV